MVGIAGSISICQRFLILLSVAGLSHQIFQKKHAFGIVEVAQQKCCVPELAMSHAQGYT
jgi:hypothetical protein